VITSATIVVWTLRNKEDDRFITVTRRVDDPHPDDDAWEVVLVDYVNVAGEEIW